MVLNVQPAIFSLPESIKALTVCVLLCNFLANVFGGPAPIPPAPWLNDHDCASALRSYDAFSMRRWHHPLRSGVKQHCMQGMRAAMFLPPMTNMQITTNTLLLAFLFEPFLFPSSNCERVLIAQQQSTIWVPIFDETYINCMT